MSKRKWKPLSDNRRIALAKPVTSDALVNGNGEHTLNEDFSMAAKRISAAEQRAEWRQATLNEAKLSAREARDLARETGLSLHRALQAMPDDALLLPAHFDALRALYTDYKAQRAAASSLLSLWHAARKDFAEAKSELETVIDGEFTFLPLFDRAEEVGK